MYPIQVTLTINSDAELTTFLAAMRVTPVQHAQAQPVAERIAEPAEPVAERVTVDEAKPAEVPAPSEITYAVAAKAVTELSKLKGVEAAREVLKAFGATTLKQIEPARYPELLARIDEVSK